MLTQSLRENPECRLLVIQKWGNDKLPEKQQKIQEYLDLSATQKEQILVQSGTAKEFLETVDLATELIAKIPAGPSGPF